MRARRSRSLLVPLAMALAACEAGAPTPPPAPAPAPCARTTAGAPWLAFTSWTAGSYDVVVARADGSCRAAVTSGAPDDLYPSWSRDDRIAFASNRDATLAIWIHDLSTGRDARLQVGELAASSPAFSPDGSRIAFEGRTPGAIQTDVYVVDATGGAAVPLAASARDDAGPAWSPDGQTVYFVSSRTGAFEIFAAPAAGGEALQVTTGSRIIGKPVVAPAGDALYHARTVSGASTTEVVRLDLATSTVQVVSSLDDSEPAVDPSGGRLALRTFRTGSADLVLVDATDGGHAFALTADAASDGGAAFAPLP